MDYNDLEFIDYVETDGMELYKNPRSKAEWYYWKMIIIDGLLIIIFVGYLVYRLFKYPKQSAKFIGGFLGLLLLGILARAGLLLLLIKVAESNPDLADTAMRLAL